MPRVLLVRVKHSEDDWPWGRHFPLQRQETFSLRWRRREKVRALNWLCSLSCSLTPPTRDSFSQYLMPVLCSTVVCWPDPWVWSPCLAWSFSRLMGLRQDVTQSLKMWHKLVNAYTLRSDAVQRKKRTYRWQNKEKRQMYYMHLAQLLTVSAHSHASLTLPAATNALYAPPEYRCQVAWSVKVVFFFFKQGRWARFGLSRPRLSRWPSQTVLIRSWPLPTAGEHIWDAILGASAAGLGNSASLGIFDRSRNERFPLFLNPILQPKSEQQYIYMPHRVKLPRYASLPDIKSLCLWRFAFVLRAAKARAAPECYQLHTFCWKAEIQLWAQSDRIQQYVHVRETAIGRLRFLCPLYLPSTAFVWKEDDTITACRT